MQILLDEIPYPGIADYFWVAGYIPVIYVLIRRLRTLKGFQFSTLQKIPIIVIGIIAGVLLVALLLIPITRGWNETGLFENLLNIAYPILDFCIFLSIIVMTSISKQEYFGQAWRIHLSGFLLVSLSDLMFTYGSINGFYYPDNIPNLISTLGTDVPYTLSYVLWGIGLISMINVIDQSQIYDPGDFHFPLVRKRFLLLIVHRDGTIFDISGNFYDVFPIASVAETSLENVFGEDSFKLKDFISNSNDIILPESEILMTTRFGEQTVFLSGMSIGSRESEAEGAVFLLRMHYRDDDPDRKISKYHQQMIRSVSDATGSLKRLDEERKSLLLVYNNTILMHYYNRIVKDLDYGTADAFIRNLNGILRAQDWLKEIIIPNFLDAQAVSLSELVKDLPLVLGTAKKFIGNVLSQRTAEQVIDEINEQVDINARIELYDLLSNYADTYQCSSFKGD